jgi:hypothetical protein
MSDQEEPSEQPAETGRTVIRVVLGSSLAAEEYEVEGVPVDVPVQTLIAKFVRSDDLPFEERDNAGNLIPYRLLWKQGQRVLNESETLAAAGVNQNDTLILAYEARAGIGGARIVQWLARSVITARGRAL